jgi:hypothetical protein
MESMISEIANVGITVLCIVLGLVILHYFDKYL